MRINVLHSCGHEVVVRRYTAFIDRDCMRAYLETRPCGSCMLATATQAIKRKKLAKDRAGKKSFVVSDFKTA